MDNNPNHKDIISNSVAGLINSNLDENNMREVLLSGNLKTHYTCKNFNKNGWYVKTGNLTYIIVRYPNLF